MLLSVSHQAVSQGTSSPVAQTLVAAGVSWGAVVFWMIGRGVIGFRAKGPSCSSLLYPPPTKK